MLPIILNEKYAFSPETLTLFRINSIVFFILKSLKKKRGNRLKILRELQKQYRTADINRALAEIDNVSQPSLVRRRKSKISSIGLFLTGNCNMECAYCYLKNKESNDDMKLEDYILAAKFFEKKGLLNKRVNIFFTGGEPLLKFDLIREIIQVNKKVKNHRFDYSITTNGLLLDEERGKFIIENGGMIKISLDGEPNSARRKILDSEQRENDLIKKIKKMVASFPTKVNARMTVDLDRPNLVKNFNYLREIGFRKIFITPEMPTDRKQYKRGMYQRVLRELKSLVVNIINKKEPKELLLIEPIFSNAKRILGGTLSYYPCGAGRDYVIFDHLGDIYSCHRGVDIDEFKIGNVAKGTFDSGFYNNYNATKREPCISCKSKHLCSGGCYFANFCASGKLDFTNDIMCEYSRGVLDISLLLAIGLIDLNQREK